MENVKNVNGKSEKSEKSDIVKSEKNGNGNGNSNSNSNSNSEKNKIEKKPFKMPSVIQQLKETNTTKQY